MNSKCWSMILSVMLCAVLCGAAWAAYPADDLQILGQKDIAALADDKLIESYIDVMVEMEAAKSFHSTSGFTPKEYKSYKEILKYRMLLLFEINRRKLELPPALD